jgi:hypothetical protein
VLRSDGIDVVSNDGVMVFLENDGDDVDARRNIVPLIRTPDMSKHLNQSMTLFNIDGGFGDEWSENFG